jgi:hypothetical protein
MQNEQPELPIGGKAQKEAGLAAAQRAADPWWQNLALKAIEAAAIESARTGVPFQSYDLVLRYGLAEPHHHSQWGNIQHQAERLGIIEHVGYAASKRPKTASSTLKTWRGTAAFCQARAA